MKQSIAIFCLLFSSLSLFAQYPADGFYRVQNYGTGRYAYVLDNTGSIDYATTSADMGAIELHRDTARLHYDPAAVIYIRQVDTEDHKFDLEAQGTGVYQLIQHYVSASPQSDGTYKVYATYSGFSKYLSESDTLNASRDISYLSLNKKGDFRKWNVIPFGTNGDYFGILPSIQIGSNYYRPFYASFAIKLTTSGLRAFYICKTYRNAAIFKELTGTVPAYTPVYILCNGANAWNNKADIEYSTATTVSDNVLQGNFFCNHDRASSRDALVAYNPVTMRVLTSTPDGKLCYAKSADLQYLPANESYLTVPSSAEDTLLIMTEEEYQVYSTSTDIEIQEDSAVLYPEGTIQLHATIYPSTAAITTAAWKSTNPAVVQVDNTGKCTALAVGQANIIATTIDGTNLSDTCPVTVKPILATHIVVSQTSFTGDLGDSLQLSATVYPGNTTDPSVIWNCTSHGVATVQNGLVVIIGVGTDTVRVSTTDGSNLYAECIVTGLAPVAQSITLSVPETIYVGDTFTPTYTVYPENATASVYQWMASNRGTIISIDKGTGACEALKVGTAVITAYATASDGHRFTATVTAKVINRPVPPSAIQMATDTLLLHIGDSCQIPYTVQPTDASSYQIVWQSSDTTTATVCNGMVTANRIGEADVTASIAGNTSVSATCHIVVSEALPDTILVQSIQLSAESASLLIGDSLQIQAAVFPYNATNRNLLWSSSDSTILSVNAQGMCYAKAEGTVSVTATAADGSGIQTTITLDVDPILVSEIILSQTTADCRIGDTLLLEATITPDNATNKRVLWSSSDSTIVRVTDGQCIALREGSANITAQATDSSMLSATCRITVHPILTEQINICTSQSAASSVTEYALTIGESMQFYANILPANTTDQTVVWESSDNAVVSVKDGLVQALAVGDADIQCTSLDAAHASAVCHITVNPIWVTLITLSESTLTLYEEEHASLKADVLPEDATDKSLVWSSSDESIATVSEKGVVTGHLSGTAVITAAASDGSGVEAQCNVEVRQFSSLEDIEALQGTHTIYDILGRRVSRIQAGGLYIIDGKVIYVKE